MQVNPNALSVAPKDQREEGPISGKRVPESFLAALVRDDPLYRSGRKQTTDEAQRAVRPWRAGGLARSTAYPEERSDEEPMAKLRREALQACILQQTGWIHGPPLDLSARRAFGMTERGRPCSVVLQPPRHSGHWGGRKLLVMTPRAKHLHRVLRLDNLVDEAMTYIDAPRIRTRETANQLLKMGRGLERVLSQYREQSLCLGFKPG